MSHLAITTENLGKRYRIGQRERYLALRDVLTNALAWPVRLLRGRRTNSTGPEYIWALREIGFDVEEGDVVGIIGRNGSGKSTLLRILSRITRPTEGRAETVGRVGTLLEVGTGFHPELTGRENVYLSGAILGMKRREIERKFDEIVAFAEMDKFIDTAVKYYSSGMHVRLAFAVAAHLEPDILLVDEVLAVGDVGFQKKCLGRMGDVARTGRTVLFVSHQMNQIRRICRNCIWLDAGRIRARGSTAETVTAYEASFASPLELESRSAGAVAVGARFVKWEILDPRAEKPNVLGGIGEVCVQFVLEVGKAVPDGHHGVALYNQENQLMWAVGVNNLKLEPGLHNMNFRLPSLPLQPGVYHWQVSIWDGGNMLDTWECMPEMIVATEPLTHTSDAYQGILNLPWQFEREKRS
jgi:lipopolysaccharide transport system ATP-binding protein